MDTSKTYIKMCDCLEIQEQWKVKEGDWFYCCCKDIPDIPDGYGVNCMAHGDADIENNELIDSPTDTWLPRQDQIQEIAWFKDEDIFNLIARFNIWLEVKFYNKNSKEGFTSLEQLWLAFYMWEKHKKKWTGKKWIA